jgi:hypothetical protein
MTLSKTEIERAAEDLFTADEKARQIGLLTLRHPQMEMDDAYAVQAALVRRKRDAGRQSDRLEDRPHLQGDAVRAQHRHPRQRRAAR